MRDTRNSDLSLKELPLTHLQLRPQGTDLSIGILLGDFAIGLKTDNETNSVSELFKVLMKSEALWSPVFPVISTEGFQGGTDAGITIRRWTGWVGQGVGPVVAQ